MEEKKEERELTEEQKKEFEALKVGAMLAGQMINESQASASSLEQRNQNMRILQYLGGDLLADAVFRNNFDPNEKVLDHDGSYAACKDLGEWLYDKVKFLEKGFERGNLVYEETQLEEEDGREK